MPRFETAAIPISEFGFKLAEAVLGAPSNQTMSLPEHPS
jgi:hypothetical protein